MANLKNNFKSKSLHFLSLAFEKAKINLGSTKRNPSVGCIVEKDGAVLSSGCTSLNGRPHAEQNALKKRKIKIPRKKWVKNFIDLSKKEDVDIIVELIGGSDGAAKKLVFSALRNKKHVITANKALIAKNGDYLSILAEKNKVNLEFEASVGGGIPILKTIKDGLATNKISKVVGILNGTSNFILSNMLDEKNEFRSCRIICSSGYYFYRYCRRSSLYGSCNFYNFRTLTIYQHP